MTSERKQVGVVRPTLYSITPDTDFGNEKNLFKNGKPPILLKSKATINRSDDSITTVSDFKSKRKTEPLINNLRDALASKGMLYENTDEEDDTDDENENETLFSEDDFEPESLPPTPTFIAVSPELELENTKTPEIVSIKRPIPRSRLSLSTEEELSFFTQERNENSSTEEISTSSESSSPNFGTIALILGMSIVFIAGLCKTRKIPRISRHTLQVLPGVYRH